MAKFVGRDKEIKKINSLYNSEKAELLAIYGRRRVGKTFLVDQTLKGRITFSHAGLSPVEDEKLNKLSESELEKKRKKLMERQLVNFYDSLKRFGYKETEIPKTWREAFLMLEQLLFEKDTGDRQVVFLDEMPWMDTPRSEFISAFEAFWNIWGCHRDNLMVVVCASANKWILDNFINNKGGLYGRVSWEMQLLPLNLAECREFYHENKVNMSDYEVVKSYMTFGGIPYYMRYVDSEKSLEQNINDLFWGNGAILKNEFDRLFQSIFDNPISFKKIIVFLSGCHKGYTRQEIIKGTGEKDGGDFSDKLKALVASGFIKSYVPFGYSKKEIHYKLIDPFCIFYLHFVYGKIESNSFWMNNLNSRKINSWRGIAFEEVCFNHIPQIKHALGISGVDSTESSWIVPGSEEKKGAQMDLLILRKDNVVNLCEIKFYSDKFKVSSDDETDTRHRITLLSEKLPKRSAIHPTIITTFGVTPGKYSNIYVKQLTLKDLFVF